MKKFRKIFLTTFTSILVVFLAIFVFLNLMQVIYYGKYRRLSENVSDNYGLSMGYVPQGLEYIQSIDKYITSAYSTDSTKASKIFVSKNEGFDLVNIDGTPHKSHVGGIAVHEASDSLFLVDDNKICLILLSDLISNIENPKTLKIVKEFELFYEVSFIYVNQDSIYVGEFYNGKEYMGSGYNFTYKKDGNTESSHALLTVYDVSRFLDNDIVPKEYLAIPNKVQGVAFLNGYYYFSTSYGLSHSYIYTYDSRDLPTVKHLVNNQEVTVKFFSNSNLIDTLEAPFMTEDITIANNLLIVHFESACNKYIIGKLYFANYIVGLDILVN